MAFPRKAGSLKLISGSREPEPASLVPPTDELLADIPAAPEYLTGDSLVVWNRTASVLVKRGLLDDVRVPLLAMYCALVGKCEMKVKAGDVPSAHMIQQCRTLARDLGITGPSSPKASGDDGRKPSRWAAIKQRADKPD